MELTRSEYGVSVTGGRVDGGDLCLHHFIGVGRNYAEHAYEQGADVPERPMLFTKNPSAAILSGDAIELPEACAREEQVDFEGELAVIIGSPARDLTEASALRCVLGYCVANDVSARWWQKKGAGGQFYRGKSFDTFCPLGPRVTPASEIADPQALHIRTTVSGEVMQDAPTSQMIFPVRTLLAEITRGTTLAPGTVILTGTPSGVGMARDPKRFLRDGDLVRIEIEGLGAIENPVRASA